MMQKLNMLDLEQLKIIHNEIDEIQINTDGVVSESGFSIRDFMKANKNDVLLFKLHNVVTNHILERLLFYD
jgi:ATP-dependent protease ClpP protease subunit